MKQFLAHMIVKNQFLDHITLMKFINFSILSNGFTSSALIFANFYDLIDFRLCNLVLRTYTHLNKHWHSIFVFVQMHKHGIHPDSVALPSVIKSVACLCRRRVGKSLHCCVIKTGFCSDLYANTSLVHMYCCCSSIDDARNLFDEIPERNSVCWNTFVNGYVHNRRYLEAFDVFRDMMRVGVELSEVTMVGILSSCANLGALEYGRLIHEYIIRNKLTLNVYVGTALIDMYAKCGILEEACMVFRAMKVKNVCTWNVLIAAYSMNGRTEDALTTFYSMTFDNYRPDDVTFLAVLSACFHDGRVGEGRSHFQSMKSVFGVEPKLEHYGCMVDLLGRVGLVNEALDLIRTMPYVPDPTIWRALHRTFEIRGYSHLVEPVILKLIELEPKNGDNFFVLANLYVQQQRWTEVDLVWDFMKDRGIDNIPGYSSIEIDNEIYQFVASCNYDPKLEDVYAVLTWVSEELTHLVGLDGTEMT
ncbi:hypothetical protein RND81_13G114600 [Saponaria officinalis]